MENIKLHHIIVLVALLVSLVGTLLVLEKMGEGIPLTSATTMVGEDIPIELPTLEEQIEIRIENQTATE